MYYIKFKKSDIYNQNFKKQLLILWYLYSKESRDGTINFSIKEIITDLKFSYSTCPNGTGIIFKDSIQDLINKKYIYTHDDIDNIKPNTILTFFFNKTNNVYECFNVSTDYVIFNNLEMNKIFDYYETHKVKTTVDNIFYIYILIKSFMNMTDQVPSFCFPSIKKLEQFSGFNHTTILKMINILQDMQLLYVYDLGNYRTKKGTIQKQSLIYTLEPLDKQILKNNIASLKKNYLYWIEDDE